MVDHLGKKVLTRWLSMSLRHSLKSVLVGFGEPVDADLLV